MTQLRLFIAVDPSAAVVERIDRFVEAEKKRGTPEGFRWIPRGNYHLTVKFLGEIGEERLAEIFPVLEAVAQGIAPFPLRFQGLGVFPNAHHPRILWTGVEAPIAELLRLASDVETGLESRGFPKEERLYSPHLTLAKLRPGTRLPQELRTILNPGERARPDFGVTEIREMLLYRSSRDGKGSRYDVLRGFPFFGKHA